MKHMKNETISVVAANTEAKLAWTAPSLTALSVSCQTLAMAVSGMDGGTPTADLT